MDAGKLNEIAGKRKCPNCGELFKTDHEGSALQKFSDHIVTHQPTPAQWADAYRIIQDKKPAPRSASTAIGRV